MSKCKHQMPEQPVVVTITSPGYTCTFCEMERLECDLADAKSIIAQMNEAVRRRDGSRAADCECWTPTNHSGFCPARCTP